MTTLIFKIKMGKKNKKLPSNSTGAMYYPIPEGLEMPHSPSTHSSLSLTHDSHLPPEFSLLAPSPIAVRATTGDWEVCQNFYQNLILQSAPKATDLSSAP